MSDERFTISRCVPCADYDGFTVEGDILDANLSAVEKAVFSLGGEAYGLADGGVLVANLRQIDIYVFASGHFIVARCSNEQAGSELVTELLDQGSET